MSVAPGYLQGAFFALITNTGKVYGSGYNYFAGISWPNNQSELYSSTFREFYPPISTFNKTVLNVSFGNYHTLFVTTDGVLYGCGSNGKGQLGLGPTIVTSNIVQNIPLIDNLGNLIREANNSLKKVRKVACGLFHTLVLMTDGTLYGTGSNQYGQLGFGVGIVTQNNGDVSPLSNPNTTYLKKITTLPIGNVKDIFCGSEFSVVLMEDNTVYSSGRNNWGQLCLSSGGNGGETQNKNSFTRIGVTELNGKTIKNISCGSEYTMILCDDGTLYGGGRNWNGQMGMGASGNAAQKLFMQIPSQYLPTGTILDISCGVNDTVLLMDNNKLYGAGWNHYGLLGLNNTTEQNLFTEITSVPSNKTIDSIKVSSQSLYVLMTDGTLWVSGWNDSGQLGTGDLVDKTTLTEISLGLGVTAGSNSYLSFAISNICFVKGSLVKTDQGLIPIETIDTTVHTINNNKILHLTKTITKQKYLICIEKDSIGKHMPSQTTYVTKDHKILYKGKMVKAVELIGKTDGAHKVDYNGELLYNVLLEKSDRMIVNNLIAETLDPEHIISKIYTKIKSKKMRDYLLEENNYCVLNNDNIRYNALYSAINNYVYNKKL